MLNYDLDVKLFKGWAVYGQGVVAHPVKFK